VKQYIIFPQDFPSNAMNFVVPCDICKTCSGEVSIFWLCFIAASERVNTKEKKKKKDELKNTVARLAEES
jgi:hypothetical protein